MINVYFQLETQNLFLMLTTKARQARLECIVVLPQQVFVGTLFKQTHQISDCFESSPESGPSTSSLFPLHLFSRLFERGTS